MWTAIANPSSTRPWPFRIGSATSKPPHKNHAVNISAKYQRRSRRRNDNDYDYGDDDEEEDSGRDFRGKGHAVVSAVECNPSIKTSNSMLSYPTAKQEEEKEEERERQLSGSDILRALQRAATRKKKRLTSLKNIIPDSNKGEQEEIRDSTSVRPLCIKSDWTTRLDQLELRLQELLDV